MTPNAAHDIVLTRGWLAQQPPDFARRLLAISEVRKMPSGGTIYGLDDPPGGIYGVVDGFVDVLLASSSLPPWLAHVMRPGSWIGAAAIVTRSPRRAGLVARTDATMIHVPERMLNRIAEEDSLTWRHVSAITVGSLDLAFALAASFAVGTPRQRLLITLDRLSAPLAPGAERTVIPVSQGELAEIAGLSRRSIVRLLDTLEEGGVLLRYYGRIVTVRSALAEALQDL